MSRREIKSQIGHLKRQMKAENRVSDVRLLKLTALMILLALIAAFLHGRLQL